MDFLVLMSHIWTSVIKILLDVINKTVKARSQVQLSITCNSHMEIHVFGYCNCINRIKIGRDYPETKGKVAK